MNRSFADAAERVQLVFGVEMATVVEVDMWYQEEVTVVMEKMGRVGVGIQHQEVVDQDLTSAF